MAHFRVALRDRNTNHHDSKCVSKYEIPEQIQSARTHNCEVTLTHLLKPGKSSNLMLALCLEKVRCMKYHVEF